MALGRKLLTRLLEEKECALAEMMTEVQRLRAALAQESQRYGALERNYQTVVRQLNSVPKSMREA